MELFDSHAHYDDEHFDPDRESLLQEIYKSGVTKLVSAGYSLASSKKGIELSKNYPFIYTTVGISPNDLPETEEDLEKQLIEIETLADDNKVVAIGEIGYDYHYTEENKTLQKIAFQKQIQIANRKNLPIVIHTREAVMDTLDMLKNIEPPKRPGIFHCCPLNRELIKEALKLDFMISFAGPITFKNSKNAPEMIQMVPLDHILIETDSPYLAPEPNRGKRNDSRNVRYVAQKIADVKELPLEQVAKITYENAERIFHIHDGEN